MGLFLVFVICYVIAVFLVGHFAVCLCSARPAGPLLSGDVRVGRRVGGAGYTVRQGQLSCDAKVVVQGSILRIVRMKAMSGGRGRRANESVCS